MGEAPRRQVIKGVFILLQALSLVTFHALNYGFSAEVEVGRVKGTELSRSSEGQGLMISKDDHEVCPYGRVTGRLLR